MEKINWISNVRVFALIGVVLLHATCGLLYDFSVPPNAYWWIGNVYDSIVRCCVPLFVMITGALLLSKEIELKPFFQKRFIRILIPFLFWSFAYILSEAYLSSLQESTNFFTNLWHSNFVTRLFKDEISVHLWYVYMLIGLLLFIPILNKWIKHCTEKEILYFLGIWLISITVGNQLVENYINEYLKLAHFSGYAGCLVLGYYLANAEKYKISSLCINNLRLKTKKTNAALCIFNKVNLFILVLIALLITIFGTYFVSIKAGKLIQLFYIYLMPNVLLAAAGVFLLIKSCKLTNKTFVKIIGFLDKYSYGIYLVHVLVLFHLERFGINAHLIYPLIGIPIITILCVGISAGIVFVVNKLPFVGKYISG